MRHVVALILVWSAPRIILLMRAIKKSQHLVAIHYHLPKLLYVVTILGWNPPYPQIIFVL